MVKKTTNLHSTHSDQQRSFPPVVTVLGHVDHGKTSLLDAIRKTSIAAREHGGITQKIGASKIEIVHEGKKRFITFIDTPGHETFSKMRSRGAQVADIGLLIVSMADGVMPQTKESMQILKDAQIPFIVVLTKADLVDRYNDKVKSQLAKEGVMVEGMGGDVPVIDVSSKTGKNIKELLDLILLVHELHSSNQDKKPRADAPLQAVVIEAKLDPKAGPRATIVVKNGTITLRDELLCEGVLARVKMMLTDTGTAVQQAIVGDAVELLGFEKVPAVGGIVTHSVRLGQAKKGEDIAQKEAVPEEEKAAYSPHVDEQKLPLIVVTDTQGSLEAILQSLPKGIKVILAKTGEISEADVLMAKSVRAIAVGFNAKLRPEVIRLAREEKILMKNYTIIYELLDEVADVLEGKQLAMEEKIFGVAKILATFPFEKTKVLGVGVVEGRIAKGDKVRLLHGDEIIGESSVISVRQGKNQVSKVEKGNECGIVIAPLLDFTLGDMIISHE